MISFEVNQQVGKPVARTWWRQWLKKIEKILKFRKTATLSLALIDDKTIKKLNKIYRNKNQVTDVLSFVEEDSLGQKFSSPAKNYLGEVIICYPQAVKQAKANKKTIKEELALLFIHGVLHLLGYDHEKSKEAKVMRELETEILKSYNS